MSYSFFISQSSVCVSSFVCGASAQSPLDLICVCVCTCVSMYICISVTLDGSFSLVQVIEQVINMTFDLSHCLNLLFWGHVCASVNMSSCWRSEDKTSLHLSVYIYIHFDICRAFDLVFTVTVDSASTFFTLTVRRIKRSPLHFSDLSQLDPRYWHELIKLPAWAHILTDAAQISTQEITNLIQNNKRLCKCI